MLPAGTISGRPEGLGAGQQAERGGELLTGWSPDPGHRGCLFEKAPRNYVGGVFDPAFRPGHVLAVPRLELSEFEKTVSGVPAQLIQHPGVGELVEDGRSHIERWSSAWLDSPAKVVLIETQKEMPGSVLLDESAGAFGASPAWLECQGVKHGLIEPRLGEPYDARVHEIFEKWSPIVDLDFVAAGSLEHTRHDLVPGQGQHQSAPPSSGRRRRRAVGERPYFVIAGLICDETIGELPDDCYLTTTTGAVGYPKDSDGMAWISPVIGRSEIYRRRAPGPRHSQAGDSCDLDPGSCVSRFDDVIPTIALDTA